MSFAVIFVVIQTAAGVGGQAPAFRSGIDLVNLGATVASKKGALVSDLTADRFEVFEDGKKQTITYFLTGTADDEAMPMHLGLLLDVSESMGDDIKFTRSAAIKFLNTLTRAVDVTLVDFDSQVRVARYEQQEFARLVERIRQQKVAGDTALYDAIGVYLDSAAEQTGRKIMLLYTDGGDTRSAIRFGELLDLLRASDVTVYVIGALDHQTSLGRMTARTVLQQIAETTGGAAFFPLSVRELDAVYDQVLAEIKAQYTLGYKSTNPATDGAWRKIEIKIVGAGGPEAPGTKDLRVRSRKGYYALFKK